LLNTVEWKAVEGKRILEGYVGRELVFEKGFVVDDYFDFAWDKRVVEDDGVGFVFEGDGPLVPLLASLDVLADFFHIEVKGFDLLVRHGVWKWM
jgi:hypothetical protein